MLFRSEAVPLLGRFEDDEVGPLVDYWRQSASPGAVEALAPNKQIDVRHVLPAIRVPALLLHGSEDAIVPIEVARYLAGQIPGAELVEISGARAVPDRSLGVGRLGGGRA